MGCGGSKDDAPRVHDGSAAAQQKSGRFGSKRSITPAPPATIEAVEAFDEGGAAAAAESEELAEAEAVLAKAKMKMQHLSQQQLVGAGGGGDEIDELDMETFELDNDGGLHKLSGGTAATPAGGKPSEISDAQRLADEAASHVASIRARMANGDLGSQNWRSAGGKEGQAMLDAAAAVEEEVLSPKEAKKRAKQEAKEAKKRAKEEKKRAEASDKAALIKRMADAKEAKAKGSSSGDFQLEEAVVEDFDPSAAADDDDDDGDSGSPGRKKKKKKKKKKRKEDDGDESDSSDEDEKKKKKKKKKKMKDKDSDDDDDDDDSEGKKKKKKKKKKKARAPLMLCSP